MISWDYITRMFEIDARRRDFSLLDTARDAISDMTWACTLGEKCDICAHYNEEELPYCQNPEQCDDDDKFIWFGVCNSNVPDGKVGETVPFFGTDIEVFLADNSVLRKILQAALHDMYSHLRSDPCCICMYRNADGTRDKHCCNCEHTAYYGFGWRGVCDENMGQSE